MENKQDKELKDDIQSVRDHITRMANAVTVYFSDEEEHTFNISDEWYKLAPSVGAIECALNSPECTVLNVVFKQNGIIRKHRHTRQEEIFVVSGSIVDKVNNVMKTQGEVYIIPPNTLHEIRSDRAKLTVVFRPPFPKIPLENAKSS